MAPGLPSQFRFKARAVTDAGAILGTRQEGREVEHVDDLIVQPLAIGGERRAECRTAEAHRAFEAA
jgi:hypothetical protein